MSYKLLLPLFGIPVLAAGQSEKPVSKPNIVIIYADDIGYGDLACYGARAVKTPNVNRLAREGLQFINAYACASTCTPSRYGLLTGQYPWRRNDTGVARGDAPMVIGKEQYTVANLLRDAGYATGVTGKWHLGLGEGGFNNQNWNGFITPGPRDIGFDYSYIMAATGDRTPCVFIENQRIVNLDPADPIEVSYTDSFPGEPLGRSHPELLKMHPSHGHDQAIVNGISRIGYMRGGKSAWWKDENIADSITAKAVRFIENQNPGKTGRPFFLYLGTQDIHVPRVPNPRFSGATAMGPRGDAIAEFDWTVGQILATLDRLGLAENTMIILSSDNGPVVDDGYRDEARERLGDHKPAGPLRGGKYSAFEGGTRIPFIIRWTGTVNPGISKALVSQVDLMATLSELTSQPLPVNSAPDSFNSLPVWLGKTQDNRSYIIQGSGGTQSLVSGDWKYITAGKGARFNPQVNIELGNDSIPRLFNLAKDPAETMNVAREKVSILQKLAGLLEEVKKSDATRKNH